MWNKKNCKYANSDALFNVFLFNKNEDVTVVVSQNLISSTGQ